MVNCARFSGSEFCFVVTIYSSRPREVWGQMEEGHGDSPPVVSVLATVALSGAVLLISAAVLLCACSRRRRGSCLHGWVGVAAEVVSQREEDEAELARAADVLPFSLGLTYARAERQAHGQRLFAASVFGGRQTQEDADVSSESVSEAPPRPPPPLLSPPTALPPLSAPPAALPPALPPPTPPPAAPPPAAPPAPEPAKAARPPRPPAPAPSPAAAREPPRDPESLRVREISANPSDTELERAALAAQYAVASVAPNGETRVPPPAETKAGAEGRVERLDQSQVNELMLRMEGMLDDDDSFCEDEVIDER